MIFELKSFLSKKIEDLQISKTVRRGVAVAQTYFICFVYVCR